MTSGFEVDPEVLARHAADFPAHAQRAGAIHAELSDALASAGACWGDDPAGQSFAAGHVADADSTMSRLGGLSGRLGDVGDRLTTTARGYQDADQGAAGLLPKTD